MLSGSTAAQKTNATALEPSPLWFRKCVWEGLEAWRDFVLSLS